MIFPERNIGKIVTSVSTLEPTPDLDVFLVEQLTKDINILTKRLSDNVDDLLSLSEEDRESLERAFYIANIKLEACKTGTCSRELYHYGSSQCQL